MRRRVTATARQTGPVLVARLGRGLFLGLTSSSAGFACPSAPALEGTNGSGGVLVEPWNVSCWPVSDCVCSEAVGEICWESEGSLGEGEACISRMTSGFSSDPCQGQWLRVGRSCWADSVSAVQTSAAPLPPLSGPSSKTGGAPSEAASVPPWGTAGVSVTAFVRRSFRVWKPVGCFQQVFPWLLAVTSHDLVQRPFCFLSSLSLAVKPVPHGSASPQAPVGSNQRALIPLHISLSTGCSGLLPAQRLTSSSMQRTRTKGDVDCLSWLNFVTGRHLSQRPASIEEGNPDSRSWWRDKLGCRRNTDRKQCGSCFREQQSCTILGNNWKGTVEESEKRRKSFTQKQLWRYAYLDYYEK